MECAKVCGQERYKACLQRKMIYLPGKSGLYKRRVGAEM